jgi:hypothetical protein
MKRISKMSEAVLGPRFIVEGGGVLVTGRQMAAARALLGIDQQALADAAKVSIATVKNLEGFGAGPLMAHANTVRKVQFAFEKMGVEFLNQERPGVRMRGPR